MMTIIQTVRYEGRGTGDGPDFSVRDNAINGTASHV
jgi:hypothetical protein